MERSNKVNIIWVLIGFITSWIISTILFRPQAGIDSWLGTAGMLLFYGYTWIIPIVGLAIYFSKDKNKFRKLLRHNYWILILIIISTITIIISWNVRFSNDTFFVLCWTISALWWLTIYFRMKLKYE